MVEFIFSFPIILFVCLSCGNVRGNHYVTGSWQNPNPSNFQHNPQGIVKLAPYKVHAEQVTLSGFSSGGSFAQQLQISYSSLFRGIAVFSHTYYKCGPGNGVEKDYDDVCTTLGNFPKERYWDVNRAQREIQRYASQGLIENPSHLQGKKLYVYTGTHNFLFTTDQSLRIINLYEPLIKNPLAIFTRVQAANLTLPSDTFGGSCAEDSSKNFFIANCGISGPYDALKFLLGDSIRKARRQLPLQPLLLFDQSEFFTNVTGQHGMDTLGYLYIPQRCRNVGNRCYLHFYFHGCTLGREFVQDNHIKNSGYLEVAEENDIILVFPQAKQSLPENEIGCWDTYGITGALFGTQKGKQVSIVRNMLTRILSSSSPNSPRVAYGNTESSSASSIAFRNIGGFSPSATQYYVNQGFYYPASRHGTYLQGAPAWSRKSRQSIHTVFLDKIDE